MTPEMVFRLRQNLKVKEKYELEFRKKVQEKLAEQIIKRIPPQKI